MSYVVPYILDAASYCTRNGSCVGSNIGIGSWSVSIPIQDLTVVYTQAEHKAEQILLYGYCVATPVGYFSKVAQVKTMHDKPAYFQT